MAKGTVRLESRLIQELKAECERAGLTMTDVVEMLVNKYLMIRRADRQPKRRR